MIATTVSVRCKTLRIISKTERKQVHFYGVLDAYCTLFTTCVRLLAGILAAFRYEVLPNPLQTIDI